MTSMRRLRVSWDGLAGMPGLSTFYYGVASPNVSDTVALFNAVRAYVPPGCSWIIPSSGDEIEDSTGKLTGGWVGSGGGNVAANATAGPYAAGTGIRVDWGTGVVVDGRRVAGSTFLCPVIGTAYENNGTINDGVRGILQTAVNTWVASGVAKGIWHRPKNGSGGLYCAISSGTVSDKVTSLRTRRS